MQKLNSIQRRILATISPTKVDRTKIIAYAEDLQRKLKGLCEERGIKATVRVEGSVAKDTWLKEEPEIDVFIRLPTTIPRKALGEISLEIARKATEGARQVERFAEHPYLEAFVDDVRLNIVPCYNVKRGKWLSATDRTPFHTDYVKEHLNESLQNEVRLLKKFLKGVEVYGAEIKTGGFSGYLCELLILHYQSFVKTLQAFASYSQKITIDVEGYYGGKEKELDRLFSESLVIVDPVDKRRNVASAVQAQKLYTLIAAARAYLKKPNVRFFYPPKTCALPSDALKSTLENRKTSLVFLTFGKIETVSDVLWGQLYKTKRALRKLYSLNDFEVLRDTVWSDERTLTVFIFEISQSILPDIKKHLGPPLERKKECEDFLFKYTDNEAVISGPYIEDGRWVVEIKRKFTDVVGLLKEKLEDGGRNIGVAEFVSQKFNEKLEVLLNNEIVPLYKENREFANFFTRFLTGKPFWLKSAKAKY
jgi:tRNA nucleotidyltransferase (CCA-adding enzyme)